MATKNFSKMSIKKLNALLETTSEEDKALIQAEIERKTANNAAMSEDTGSVSTSKVGASTVAVVDPGTELSPEEKALLDAAEQEYAEAEANGEKPEGHKPTKLEMSEEEVNTILEDCKKNLLHKCEIMPTGEIDWIEGVIVGVMRDKRSNAIMYRIKDVRGKMSHKAYTAKTLRIKDEVIEKTRVYTSRGEEPVKRTDEEAEKLKAEAIVNKGRKVTLKTDEGEMPGLIRSVMHDKRSNAVMYKIDLENGKSIYKVVNSEAITMLDEWDEEIKNRAAKRAEAEANKVELTPIEKVKKYEAEIEKTEAAIEKMKLKLEALKEQLEKAKVELAEQPEATDQPVDEADQLVDEAEQPVDEAESLM